MDRAVTFLHIPKTAGSSLVSALKERYKKVLSYYPPDGIRYRFHPDDAELLIGHFAYGFEKAIFIDRPNFLFTFLRDPIDRFVSQFYYDLTYFKNRGEPINLPAESAKHFVEEHIKNKKIIYFDNCLVRYLSGRWNYVPLGKLTSADLNLAKNNLKYFDFIGDSSRFEESLKRLSGMLGVELKPHKENIGNYSDRAELRRSDVPEQFVALDNELYNYYLSMSSRFC